MSFCAAPERPGALHIVYGSGNDLRTATGLVAVDDAVPSLRTILDDLVDAEARDILVPNLPDFGRAPEARE